VHADQLALEARDDLLLPLGEGEGVLALVGVQDLSALVLQGVLDADVGSVLHRALGGGGLRHRGGREEKHQSGRELAGSVHRHLQARP